jgi:hypothetical protein
LGSWLSSVSYAGNFGVRIWYLVIIDVVSAKPAQVLVSLKTWLLDAQCTEEEFLILTPNAVCCDVFSISIGFPFLV